MEKMQGLEKKLKQLHVYVLAKGIFKKVMWTDCMQKNEEEQFKLAHRNV